MSEKVDNWLLAFNDPDRETRITAINTVITKGISTSRGDRERLHEAAWNLLDDPDPIIQAKAVNLLTRLKTQPEPTFRLLISLIKADNAEVVHRAALQSLHFVKPSAHRFLVTTRDLLISLIDERPAQTDDLNNVLKLIGFDPALRDQVCYQCQRTQDYIRLFTCQNCGKIVCKDHAHLTSYCSKTCYVKYNTERYGTNPQYW